MANGNYGYQSQRPGLGDYSCELSKAFLVFTPPQHDVFYRPLEVHVQGDEMNTLVNATNGGTVITPTALATIAPQIISPSGTPIDRVLIPEGLNSARYAFFIELTRITPMGREREIISGYTNYDGVSHGGFVDPQMLFHVNNRMVINESESMGVGGDGMVRGVRDANVVLNPIPNRHAYSMRPEDAVAYQQTEFLRSGFSGGSTFDKRLTLDGIAKFGDMKHSIPGNYMSDICNGYVKGIDPTANEYEQSGADVYNDVLTHVSSGNSHLYSAYVTAFNDITKTSCFTYGDLERQWPRNHDFWQIVRPQFGASMSMVTEYSAHWDNALVETNIAFAMTHILPGLMSKMMLTKLDIGIGNMTPGQQLNVVPMGWATMFEDTLNHAQLTYLVGQIEQHIVHGLIYPKAPVFDMFLSIDLLSNSVFDISINGQSHIRYNAPNFCSSYYSPLIGLEEDNLRHIASNMENISKYLRDASLSYSNRPAVFSGQPRRHVPEVAPKTPVPNIVDTWNNFN